jgi:hypothetical protein
MEMERYRASKLLRARTRSLYTTKYDNKSMYRAKTVPAMLSSASMSPQLRASLSSSLRPNACQGSKDGHQVGGQALSVPIEVSRELASVDFVTHSQHPFVIVGLSLLSTISDHHFDSVPYRASQKSEQKSRRRLRKVVAHGWHQGPIV